MMPVLLEIFPPAKGYALCAGTQITDIGEIEFKRRFEAFWTFQGKSARVLVGSNHSTLSRNDALLFATAFMAGKVVTISIDLKSLTITYS